MATVWHIVVMRSIAAPPCKIFWRTASGPHWLLKGFPQFLQASAACRRTLYSPLVTICTTSLTFTYPTFCPHSVFMCFVWISEQTAIISLYNINWLVCITETECVYCAVRTGSLNAVEVNIKALSGWHNQFLILNSFTCLPMFASSYINCKS